MTGSSPPLTRSWPAAPPMPCQILRSSAEERLVWINFHDGGRPQKSFEFVSSEERDTFCSLCTVLAPEVPVTDDGETKAGPHVVIYVVWTLTSGARRRERALRVDVERRTLTIQKRGAAAPVPGSQSEVRPATAQRREVTGERLARD